MRISGLALLITMLLASCVSSKPFEEAQLVGKGNRAIEGTLSRAVFARTLNESGIARLVDDLDVGTLGVNYIYGAAENVDVSFGIDIPVGVHAKAKYVVNTEALRHLHGISFEARVPLYYLAGQTQNFVRLAAVPSYIYTYRYDDLFSMSANSFLNTSITNQGFIVMPGIAAGISLGNELKFNAGANYSRTVFTTTDGQFQFLTIESSVKYEF